MQLNGGGGGVGTGSWGAGGGGESLGGAGFRPAWGTERGTCTRTRKQQLKQKGDLYFSGGTRMANGGRQVHGTLLNAVPSLTQVHPVAWGRGCPPQFMSA